MPPLETVRQDYVMGRKAQKSMPPWRFRDFVAEQGLFLYDQKKRSIRGFHNI
jgi:hypothetical protein